MRSSEEHRAGEKFTGEVIVDTPVAAQGNEVREQNVGTPINKFRQAGEAALLLLLLSLALCAPILTGKVPVASNTLGLWAPWSQLPHQPITNSATADSALLYLPWNSFARSSIADGEWPLWNPYTFSGASYAANSQSQLYYPLTWLLWLLPLSGAIQALTLFNIWMAGFGMYLLSRHLGAGHAGALLSALAFCGSGLLQLALELPGISTPYGWLPWMLLALDKALTLRSARYLGLAVLACGLQLLSGNLQWCIYSYFMLSCWAFWRAFAGWRQEGRRTAMRTLGITTWVLAGGLALAAIHLVPVLELSGLSNRSDTRVSSNSGGLYYLLRLLMPNYFGTSVGDVGAPLVFNDLWYVGLGALLLALLAVVLRVRRDIWLWLAVAIFAVLVTYGIGPFLYVRWLPGLSSLLPARIGYLFIFGVSLLAGAGLDGWLKTCATNRRHAVIAVSVVFSGTTLLLLAAWVAAGTTTEPRLVAMQHDQLVRASLLLLGFTALLALPLIRGARRTHIHSAATQVSKIGQALLAIGVLTLTCGDLLTVAPDYNSFVEPATIVPDSPAVDWLRSQSGEWRVMALGTGNHVPTLVPNVQMLYGFDSVAGYDSLHTRRYEEYWAAVDPTISPPGRSGPYANVFLRPQAYSSTLAALLNVRYIASAPEIPVQRGLDKVYDGEIKIYEKTNAFPRAFTVPNSVVLGRADALKRISTPDFDPTTLVVLESGDAPPAKLQPGNGEPGEVSIASFKRNEVTIEAAMSQPGWLVLADQNYPGWRATVDNLDQQIYTADYLLRAVPLGPGHHTVVFRFLPSAFVPTAVISVLALGLVLLAIVSNSGYRRGVMEREVREKSGI